MKMIKVKMLDSVSGLGDPSPTVLEKKYHLMTLEMQGLKKAPHLIDDVIEAEKKRDAAAARTGFPTDYSFKPGETVLIPAAVAGNWQDSGRCVILDEKNEKAVA
jgi:hypothetical protein